MKLQIITKKAALAALLVFVSATGMTTMPNALASESPGLSALPSPIPVGGDVTIMVERTAAGPHRSDDGIRVYDPDVTFGIDPGGVLACGLPSGAGGDIWELRDAVDPTKRLGYKIPNTAGESVSVPFTGFGGVVTMTPTGASNVRLEGTGDLGVGVARTAVWFKIVGAGTGSDTDKTGTYGVLTCGKEGSLFSNDYQQSTTFKVQVPVGGEIIPIDTVALLVAGAQLVTLWLLPLMAAAGGAFTLLAFQLRRRQ